MLIFLYALTTFVGAALLFVVEPMAARQLLPTLGGAPAVWITCVLFFQAALLVGYGYAHALIAYVPRRVQPLLHFGALIGAWSLLPLQSPATAPDASQTFPILWLLGQLLRTLGAPFVVTSATAPIIQGWLSGTRHKSASDPYFLYAASNAGSLLALLAYPTLIEPNLALSTQTRWWTWGFASFALLLVLSGIVVLAGPSSTSGSTALSSGRPAIRPSLRSISAWLALSALPSSLMLGVTSFATTDVAPVPLLWVAPLAVYLATFILAFMRKPLISHDRAMRWLPFAVGLVGLMRLAEVTQPIWLVLPAHFAAFFVIALACHSRLADVRPPSDSLTLFYFVVSAGGVVGSAFNAVVAPMLFSSLAEYPLAVVAASFLPLAVLGWHPESTLTWQELERGADAEVATRRSWLRALWRELAPAAAIAVVVLLLLLATRSLDDTWRMFLLAQAGAAAVAVALVYRARPLRFAGIMFALLLVPVAAARTVGTIHASRSFFAVHKVVDDRAAQRHLYVQGTTIHGLQSTIPDRRSLPGAYFHRRGPAGDVLGKLHFRHAAMIGLGVGSLAAYAGPGQHIEFFEIDPDVAAIAENPSLFSFLHDARQRGADIGVVLGDARLTLAAAPDGAFDLVVLDAYNSDVVPVHLLTREALDLYCRKLAPGGIVLMNMSSRYLELGGVVSALARDMGWTAEERTDLVDTDEGRADAQQEGRAASRWIVLAQAKTTLEALALPPAWHPLPGTSARAWSDDYVNLVGSLRW